MVAKLGLNWPKNLADLAGENNFVKFFFSFGLSAVWYPKSKITGLAACELGSLGRRRLVADRLLCVHGRRELLDRAGGVFNLWQKLPEDFRVRRRATVARIACVQMQNRGSRFGRPNGAIGNLIGSNRQMRRHRRRVDRAGDRAGDDNFGHRTSVG